MKIEPVKIISNLQTAVQKGVPQIPVSKPAAQLNDACEKLLQAQGVSGKAQLLIQNRTQPHRLPLLFLPETLSTKEAHQKIWGFQSFIKRDLKPEQKIIKDSAIELTYEVGTMIEIPRAALTADDIAKEADFFCFGTNDLTQMTFGFSRDDAGKFLNAYYDTKIFENDPFAKLDQTGVGKLMELSIKLGKPVNPKLHVGICGEHGGDPSSVEFCHKIGLDYVSCSPFRVPIARLAAAQAAIQN